MKSHDEFPLAWFSAPVIWVSAAALVNSPVQCVKVDFEDKYTVK
jgi:hypothetical protein